MSVVERPEIEGAETTTGAHVAVELVQGPDELWAVVSGDADAAWEAVRDALPAEYRDTTPTSVLNGIDDEGEAWTGFVLA